MKNISIRLKITIWFSTLMILLVGATFCAIMLVDYSVIQKAIRDNLIETVERNSREIEFFSSIDEDEMSIGSDQYISYNGGYLEIDEDYLDSTNGISTALYSEKGELMYGENPLAKHTAGLAFADRKVQDFKADGVKYYILDCALSSDGTQGLWLRGIVSENQGTQQFSAIVKFSAISLPALLVLAVIGGYLIASRTLKPVHKITEAAMQINQGRDLNKRINLGEGNDELHQLANVFDDMFCRLDNAFKAERQFTSDVSHELRTPMSVIMAQCEYTLEEERTAAEYRESLQVISRQGQKMSRLIEDMLCFARLEQNSESYPKERLDFSQLVEEISVDMSLLKAQDITLEWNIQPSIQLYGNRTLLTRLLTNLISNAYRYGKQGGHITVSLSCDDEILLTVEDDGIGIPSKQQKNIFERFYRGDCARTTEGTGLGLAMVKDIAAYHGGSTEVTSQVGKGSCFFVHFPI